MKVRDLMTTDVATVGRSATLKDVASILTERGISGLPVVDAAGHVLGVVSEADIVWKEASHPRRAGGLLRRLGVHDGRAEARLAARTAGEAMTSPALTIEADRAVADAASLMVEKGVKRLPVVAGEKLTGIVTRADLVRAFVRSDEQIAREIREEVALGTFAVAPENLHVEVVDGEVTLGGEVDTPDVVSLLAEFAQRVAGVVAVHSHLTSRTDRELSERR